ncbi:phosphotransferase enzyme family protein [Streptomyces sp. NPDC090083]|uniref:phosphotransferase enzyme family protein n=1 Tax=Streptomyces sp. NPDC090083 TaxID=3365941 RepID=UPI00380A6459
MTNIPGLATAAPPPETHGLGYERVEPDWAPITAAEASDVLNGPARLHWHSPRPLSAAAVVEHDGRRIFLKRHHVTVRTLDGLGEEHGFLRHLRSRGAPVVDVLATAARGEWTYEVHTLGVGNDLYQDALSWTPFASAAHARQAGAALARLHLAARGYDVPARRAQPLVASFSIFSSPDASAALAGYTAHRPALAEALQAAPLQPDLERWHLPLHAELTPHLGELEPLWTHNDWHASNLLWDDTSETSTVSTVLDFNLSDRTTAMHDLAVALERNTFGWLDLPHGQVHVHQAHMTALLEGYVSVRPFTGAEAEALPALLPLVNAEFALSEMHYFHEITRSVTNTALARAYFTDHTRWFTSEEGQGALRHLRETARELVAR